MIDFPEAGAACRIGRGEVPSSQGRRLGKPWDNLAGKYLFQCTNPVSTYPGPARGIAAAAHSENLGLMPGVFQKASANPAPVSPSS
jgi:hypothetical protein